MQLGLVSAVLPDLPLQGVLEVAMEAGLDCVELMCWPPGRADRRYAGVTHLDVTSLDDGGAASVAESLAATPVAVSALGYYPNVLSPDVEEAEASIRHLRAVFAAAARLGIGQVNTFVGRDWTRSVDANWPEFLRVWRPLVEDAERLGVRVGIENCPMLFTGDEWPGGKNLASSPAIWRRMFADIPSPSWGLNFDPSHFVWQQLDVAAAIREFASRILHVHAKDARIDRHRLADVGILADPLQYHVPKLPGLGDVDWGGLFSALSDAEYDGAVCIEIEDRAYERSLDTRKSAVRQSARFLRQYIA